MLLGVGEIAKQLEEALQGLEDRLLIAPQPNIEMLKKGGSASIDLRLGTWFITTRASRLRVLDIYDKEEEQPSEHALMSKQYVPFREDFILHPRSFVLAATLEWIRMPRSLAGYVTGKSSWGRRGLVIETAPGVHPGFAGCLTLELANVGEIPIVISPGTRICQLFVHRVETDGRHADQSAFVAQRQPVLGKIVLDPFAEKLRPKKK